MAKILNFGSVNMDSLYRVDHFAKPGETLCVQGMERYPGGRGFNQSVALARAGAAVWQAGKIGMDGLHLLDWMSRENVRTELMDTGGSSTGQSATQVEHRTGRRCTLLYPAANFEITEDYMRRALSKFEPGDLLLLQNEINGVDQLIELAWEKGMQIAMNPSPISHALERCDLSKVNWLLLNEVEGNALTGETSAKLILEALLAKYPKGRFVLTIGKDGVVYRDHGQSLRRGIYDVPEVDTTAAGDTFTGFFLSTIANGLDVEQALRTASVAASITVSRRGGTASMPTASEVRSMEQKWEK